MSYMSSEISELAKALAKAQGAMGAAQVDATNPHFKSKYATLAAVLDAVRKPLTDNGLSVSQVVMLQTIAGDVRYLRTMLLHTSGQWLASDYPLPASATPQQMGSALTYARRYSLSAIICNAVDDDDDATAAETVKPAPPKPAPRAPRAAKPSPAKQEEERMLQEQEVKAVITMPDGPMNMQQITEFEQQAKNAARRGSLSLSQFWRNLSTQQERNIVEGLRSDLIRLRDEADAKLADADPETGETNG